MIECKITVLKKIFNPDLVEEYGQPEIHPDPCPHCMEGQVFITSGQQPEGFCGWAWNDIEKVLMVALLGGDFSRWMKDENVFIACCTYGIEPVVFKLEKIDSSFA
jgi:uncharacterized repeat protein (TIGR04076 family)